MKVLVTGGAGFIGSHLVRALEKQGHEPYNVDIREDMSIKGVSSWYLKDNGIEIVFHLAAYTDVQESIREPLKYFENNVSDTVHLIEECRHAKIKRFIFASSAAVYGQQEKPSNYIIGYNPYTDNGINENTARQSTSPYAASKLIIENYLNMYRRVYNFDSVILRYFNVYGPGTERGVIPSFMGAGFPLINGDGSHVRDFVHVDDVVRANIHAMEINNNFNIFNVGTGKGTSILELARLANKIKKRKTDAVEFTEDNNDIKWSVASTRLASDYLGFDASITLEEGLKTVLIH